MPDEKLPRRTLRTAFWLTAWCVLVFGVRGQAAVSVGLAVGGALSLLSLWSLTWAVPHLLTGASPAARVLLGVVLLMKLPIYALVLGWAVSSRQVSPFALFAGVGVVPAVIVLKVLGHRLVESAGRPAGDKRCRSKSSASS